MALTFTQSDLDSLKEALVTGAEEISIGDRTIKFRSKSDLLELIRLAEDQLSSESDKTANTATVVSGFCRIPNED